MVIRDIKREMPLKYWSFKVAEWIARIGMIGFVSVPFLRISDSASSCGTQAKTCRNRLPRDALRPSLH
jgi:hypothetical protein